MRNWPHVLILHAGFVHIALNPAHWHSLPTERGAEYAQHNVYKCSLNINICKFVSYQGNTLAKLHKTAQGSSQRSKSFSRRFLPIRNIPEKFLQNIQMFHTASQSLKIACRIEHKISAKRMKTCIVDNRPVQYSSLYNTRARIPTSDVHFML